MKFLKTLTVIIVILAIIFVVGSFFLPKSYTVNRTTLINAPDTIIYQNIANFNAFYQWNPWAKMEPSAKVKFSGTPMSPNHLYEWKGKETGSGYMKILTLTPNRQVNMELKFIEPFESVADTRFDIAPEGNGNKVTWTMSGKYNMFTKWMCVFKSMDSMVGKDFESGLKSLKDKSEKGI
ncbi:polyketide cyclase [Pedobacter petrophilus]|uniref:Polyketide cyclase n=1 Tax=Pedobacter petrophilus TaxID=1908241 RepID=A0A7K0G393_9SPHI|nr:SRPBCC family protein [Pedobacter petrophilus]MRX78278.1 polyketide cyclase [Pedobacter petrophilus]